MKKISKALLFILLLVFGVVINQCTPSQKTQVTPTYVEEAPKTIKKIYFKDGETINCDICWQGLGGNILCKKSEDIRAYSAADVDLTKTFGESRALEIAQRYEKIKGKTKEREDEAKALASVGLNRFAGGPTSFSTSEIKISDFGYTTSRGHSWDVSCVIENLTSRPRSGAVYLQAVTSTGYVIEQKSLGFYKLWPGVPKQYRQHFYSSSNYKYITKWLIYDLRSHDSSKNY